MALAPAEPISTELCLQALGQGQGDRRRSRPADHQAQRAVEARGLLGRRTRGEDTVAIGQRNRADDGDSVDAERDMDGPVGAAGLAVFAGSIQRIDDPGPPAAQPRRVIDALLREDGILRVDLVQGAHDQVVRVAIRGVAQFLVGTPFTPQAAA